MRGPRLAGWPTQPAWPDSCPQCWGYECLRSLKPEPSAPGPVGKAFEAFCPWGKEGGKPASWARPCQLRGCWPPAQCCCPGLSPAAATSSPPWPRQLCPSPQGPWACGSRSTCIAPKSCRRRRRRAAARPVRPRTGAARRAQWAGGDGSGVREAAGPSTPALPSNPCCTVLCLRSLIFGAITCFTGFLGVVTGAGATRWCRLRTQRADPLVCAVGMLGSAIFICLIFVAAKSSIVGAYVSAVGVPGWPGSWALEEEMQSDLGQGEAPPRGGFSRQSAPALSRAVGLA